MRSRTSGVTQGCCSTPLLNAALRIAQFDGIGQAKLGDMFGAEFQNFELLPKTAFEADAGGLWKFSGELHARDDVRCALLALQAAKKPFSFAIQNIPFVVDPVVTVTLSAADAANGTKIATIAASTAA